jgi:hypothetical protein
LMGTVEERRAVLRGRGWVGDQISGIYI